MTTWIRTLAGWLSGRARLAADRLLNRGRRTRWRCPRCQVPFRSPLAVGQHLYEYHALPVDVAEEEMREARAFVVPRPARRAVRRWGRREGTVR